MNTVRLLYREMAAVYEAAVGPAFAPLADGLAAWIGACWAAHQRGDLYDPFDLAPARPARAPIWAADLGAGTGLLGGRIARWVAGVAAVDLSPEMLRAGPESLWPVAADLHAPPFRAGAFGLVVSSFGLNTTDPRRVLKAIARITRPNGLLIFQEWGALDALSGAVDDVLAGHLPDDLPEMAAFTDTPHDWHARLQDSDDYQTAIRAAGFRLAWAAESPFTPVHFHGPEPFIAYKMAWPARQIAARTLTDSQRRALDAALHDAIRPLCAPDGSLTWYPPLMRVCAVR